MEKERELVSEALKPFEVIETKGMTKELAIHLLSNTVRSLELGILTLNEEWGESISERREYYQKNNAPILRMAVNFLAGKDLSASWAETSGFSKIDD